MKVTKKNLLSALRAAWNEAVDCADCCDYPQQAKQYRKAAVEDIFAALTLKATKGEGRG